MRGPIAITFGLTCVGLALFGNVSTLWRPTAHAAGPALSLAVASTSIPADDDDEDEDEPKRGRLPKGKARGLMLSFGDPSGNDTRVARVAALYVPEGEPASPFLPAGPFTATFAGEILVPFRTEAKFSVEGRGSVEILIANKSVLKADGDTLTAEGKTAKLKKGPNPVVIRYTSPKSGDAALRVFWSGEEFEREPIAPTVLMHPAKDPIAASGRKLREGREMLATMRCLNCHKPETTPTGMPELGMDAPSLADAGARLSADWIARWIADPRGLRPTATMPAMLHGATKAADARDIAAYLALQGALPPKPPEPLPLADAATLGGRLFAQLGCIGCHTAPDREDYAADPKRVPLRFVQAKYSVAALREFLQQPDRHYQWVRMPNFGFSDAEAMNLVAFLRSKSAPLPLADPAPAANPERGKSLFASVGCVQCHALPGVAPLPSVALKQITADHWQTGCMDPQVKDGRKAPDFGLSDSAREALKTFAQSGTDSLQREVAPEFAERQIKLLRCESCHRRDGQDDAWTDLKPEVAGLLVGVPTPEIDPEGHPYPAEEVRPLLTWTGEKLKPEWAAAFIAGRIPYKPRPYLHARMPAFPKRAEGIARGLAFEHGYPATSFADAAPDEAQAKIARELVKPTGLGCATCHKLGPQAAVGVFEAPGINFAHVKERLRKPYFDRWLRAPIRVDPDTKMPSFFVNGKSTLPTILDGDAPKQAEALWNFMLQGERIGKD